MKNIMVNEFRTLPIGTIFTYKGNKYKVCKNDGYCWTCGRCAFKKINCDTFNHIRGNCSLTNRTDHTSVYFVQINDDTSMNKACDNTSVISPIFNTNDSLNDLHIDCPKGYSIDVKHSDLSKGIIKFKNANITLEDIPCIIRDDIKINAFISESSTYYNYLRKLKAIAILIDIANYYNKGWKPNWNNYEEAKYYIGFSNNINKNDYDIGYKFEINHASVFFKNKEDAQAVIDNPNFRYILDAIYKN